jgi:hypothetical protein
MNSAAVLFDNGQFEVISRNALKKAKQYCENCKGYGDCPCGVYSDFCWSGYEVNKTGGKLQNENGFSAMAVAYCTESKMVLGEKSMSYAPLPERTLLYTPLPERTLPLKRRLFEK